MSELTTNELVVVSNIHHFPQYWIFASNKRIKPGDLSCSLGVPGFF
jgi:hypothetical protein